jgi:GGDEF domain-containing protein/anti-sigma regulatory factor (Ser/Thr protein kinase)
VRAEDEALDSVHKGWRHVLTAQRAVVDHLAEETLALRDALASAPEAARPGIEAGIGEAARRLKAVMSMNALAFAEALARSPELPRELTTLPYYGEASSRPRLKSDPWSAVTTEITDPYESLSPQELTAATARFRSSAAATHPARRSILEQLGENDMLASKSRSYPEGSREILVVADKVGVEPARFGAVEEVGRQGSDGTCLAHGLAACSIALDRAVGLDTAKQRIRQAHVRSLERDLAKAKAARRETLRVELEEKLAAAKEPDYAGGAPLSAARLAARTLGLRTRELDGQDLFASLGAALNDPLNAALARRFYEGSALLRERIRQALGRGQAVEAGIHTGDRSAGGLKDLGGYHAIAVLEMGRNAFGVEVVRYYDSRFGRVVTLPASDFFPVTAIAPEAVGGGRAPVRRTARATITLRRGDITIDGRAYADHELQLHRPVLKSLEERLAELEPETVMDAVRAAFAKRSDAAPPWHGEGLPIVLRELLVNAQRAAREGTRKGDGKVAVEAAVVDGRLRIVVRNTGEDLRKVDLEKYFREGATTKKGMSNVGVGLTRSRRLVREGFDGDLTLVADPAGNGAIATVVLPLGLGSRPRRGASVAALRGPGEFPPSEHEAAVFKKLRAELGEIERSDFTILGRDGKVALVFDRKRNRTLRVAPEGVVDPLASAPAVKALGTKASRVEEAMGDAAGLLPAELTDAQAQQAVALKLDQAGVKGAQQRRLMDKVRTAFVEDAHTKLAKRTVFEKVATKDIELGEDPIIGFIDMNNFGAYNRGLEDVHRADPMGAMRKGDLALAQSTRRLLRLGQATSTRLGRLGGEELGFSTRDAGSAGYFMSEVLLEMRRGRTLFEDLPLRADEHAGIDKAMAARRETGARELAARENISVEEARKRLRMPIGDYTMGIVRAKGMEYKKAIAIADAALIFAKKNNMRGEIVEAVRWQERADGSIEILEVGPAKLSAVDQARFDKGKRQRDAEVRQMKSLPSLSRELAQVIQHLTPEEFQNLILTPVTTDPVTKLGTLYRYAERKEALLSKYKDGFKVVVLKPKAFKYINDAGDHGKGDMILARAGQHINDARGRGWKFEAFRRGQTTEFLLIGPHAERAAARIRDAMAGDPQVLAILDSIQKTQRGGPPDVGRILFAQAEAPAGTTDLDLYVNEALVRLEKAK